MMQYGMTLTSFLERAGKLFPGAEVISRLPDNSLHRSTYSDLYRRARALGALGYRRFRASRKWPAARGTVTESDVYRHGEGNWWPRVRYGFEVDGKQVSSDRIWPIGDWTIGLWWARRVVARFPVGSAVAVRYNPRKPADACLMTSHPFPVLVELWIAALLGAFVYWFGRF
jgi:hypothetical protein